MQYYSYVLNRHYIGNYKELEFKSLLSNISELKEIDISSRKKVICDYLSSLIDIEDFIYNNYSVGGTKRAKI